MKFNQFYSAKKDPKGLAHDSKITFPRVETTKNTFLEKIGFLSFGRSLTVPKNPKTVSKKSRTMAKKFMSYAQLLRKLD